MIECRKAYCHTTCEKVWDELIQQKAKSFPLPNCPPIDMITAITTENSAPAPKTYTAAFGGEEMNPFFVRQHWG
jgi:hypothetical protein